MTTKSIKNFSCILACFLFAITAIAKQNPVAVYKSKKVYFSKPHPKNGSAEPFKEMDNGAGMYLFTLYNNHIIIRTNETTDLKIVTIKKHKDEMRYNLLDTKGRHFELYFTIENKPGKDTNINLIEFDSKYVPVATYMMLCEKQ